MVIATPSGPASAVATDVLVAGDLASGFTFLSYGDASLGNSETEGSVAVRGEATFTKGYPIVHTTGLTPTDYDLPTVDGDYTRLFASTFNWAGSSGASDISSRNWVVDPDHKGFVKLGPSATYAVNPRGSTGIWISAPGTSSGTTPGLHVPDDISQPAGSVSADNAFDTYFDHDYADALVYNEKLTQRDLLDTVNVVTLAPGSHGGARSISLVEGAVNIVDLGVNNNFNLQWGNAVRPSATTPLIFNVAVTNGANVVLPKFEIVRAGDAAGDPNAANPNTVAPFVLYNFDSPSASPISYTIGGTLISGTIFAPQDDHVTINASSPIEGQIIVNDVTTLGGEFHHYTSRVRVRMDLPPPPGSAVPVDLALRKTVVGTRGTPTAGSATFRIEVFNQGANDVEDVTVVDYIDTSSFQPVTSAPAAGTTGGDANLPYTWDFSDSSMPAVSIDGVIAAGESVWVELTLDYALPVTMMGRLNTAEIARFDNDGDSSNGDSTTGDVYDVDSIPDTTNDDELVDDEVDEQRWTNTPSSSTENSGATDEDDHDIAVVPVFDLALIKERAAGQDQVILAPASTATFDITVKNQGTTDVYDVIVLDTPTSPLALSASTQASQSVTTVDGASVTVTYDSTTGRFTVPALSAGDAVTFQVVSDLALTPQRQVNTAEIVSFDDDADSGNALPSWVQDLDSTPDADPTNDVLQPGVDPDFPEDSHNDIDNAPVNGANSDDEDDHDSEAVQLGLLRLGSTVYKDANGNDAGDPGEEVAGVLVQLFDGSGTLVASTVTDANGDYSFDQLYPGTYQVGIPAAQSGTGVDATALTDWEPVPGSVADPEASNFDNDGDAETGFLSRSDDIMLTFGAEPTNDDADDADADALTSPRTYADENSNLNIDFVFEQPSYELGNLVWADTGAGANYNNGVADSDEAGIDGVTVELYRDNGAGAGVAGDGVVHPDELIATATTAGGGFYTFTGLLAGDDYIVHIPVDGVPVGYGASGTPVAVGSADGIDNDNNAVVDGSVGWSSGAIELGPLGTSEPTGENDGTTGDPAAPAASVADDRADQTVDFGFIPSVRIGNQVWRDESDTDPQTEVATDNNGRFDAGELGLAGVTVELWLDVDNDGTFERGGDDGATALATTTTTSEGNYWFEGVRPDRQYFVVIPDIGSVAPYTAQSSDGQSAAVGAFDNDDDGAPVGSDLAVSRPFTPSEGGASLNEADAVEPGDGTSTADADAETEANAAGGTYDDNDSELRIDFGFVNVPVYRIGNLVWLDNGGSASGVEADGVADVGEPGIAGVEVQLWDGTATTQLATTTTDSNGEYAFENLAAGTYTVRIPQAGTNATTLAGLTSTQDGATANSDTDNDDDGRIASGAWSSTAVTVGAANAFMGAEPTDEEQRDGAGAGYDTGLSLTPNPNDPPVYANNRSNLTVDFGFTQEYRVGNLVWLDLDNDGVAEDGEPGIAGVTVQLVDPANGAVLATVATDADGAYEFTGLTAGDYVVRVDPTTVPAGLYASGTRVADANNDVDNDNNAAEPVGPAIGPGATVTLGAAAEPATETVRDDDATDDDADSFADNLSNYSVDFGFWNRLRLGNVVWHDELDNDPTTVASTDNNGVLDTGETLLAGVRVDVWLDGGNGDFDAGEGPGADDMMAGTDTTDAEGNWLVTNLPEGTYFAAIQALPSAYAGWVSSSGQQSDADDNDDNGAPATDGAGNAYLSVSGPIALAIGNAPQGESDTLPAGDGSAETEATAGGLAFADDNSDLTIDFGFVTPPAYRVGNLVWRDTNADGVADAGEPGIAGVLVQLFDGAGALINETVTDAQGFYEFTETVGSVPLAAGDYEVRLPVDQSTQALGLGLPVVTTALDGLATSPTTGGPEEADNDDDGVLSAGAWTSETVTLGDTSGTGTFETEPTTEVRRTDSADDDLGWSGGTDARSQYQVDFGFVPGLRLGDQVWFDDGRTGVSTFDVAFDNDGIRQGTELVAVGVDVVLYEDDGDGVFEPGGDDGAPVATTTTDGDGQYYFAGLAEGTYFVAIADGEQASGQPLEGWVASTPVSADGAGTNDTNHGAAATGFASVTGPIALVRGAMAYGESGDEVTADTKTGASIPDADSNLTADFGFVNEPLYRLGNLVWLDADDDGIADSGEAPLDGISVQLIEDDGNGILELGTDAVVDTVVTDAAGRYEFTDLSTGTYFVYVAYAPALAGLDSSQVREAAANNNVDNDNNALPLGASPADGWASGAVELGAIGTAGDNDEPTGETDGLNSASAEDGAVFDERSNMTVDFGFAERYRVGNQVWRDESDDDASTVVSTDNDGVFNGTEVGIAGVEVELWQDVDGDGFEAGDDDVLVATTTTNAEGNYVFDNLLPGDYVVAIATVGAPGEVRSSGGQSAASQAADNDDDGAPIAGYLSVSDEFTLGSGPERTGEVDAIEPGDGTSLADASAEDEANALGLTFPDANSGLDVDFGFVDVPLYRVGNLVWLDSDNDGVAEAGEDPIEGVLVQLLNSAGDTVLAEAVTDVNGEYAFANLAAGDYVVRIPSAQAETLGGGLTVDAAALDNLAISTVTAGDPDTDADDNDNNGAAVAAGWTSAAFTLGGVDDEVTETEPTNEVDRNGGDDDTGWAEGTDGRSDFTVDFGFYELLRLGDLVWLDNGGAGASYDPADENNGVWDAGEPVVDGASVQLFRDGGDGVFGGDDTPAGTTTTADGGLYFFDGLTEGTYFVAIPDGMLATGQPLAGTTSSTGQAADDAANSLDQGEPEAGFAAVSNPVVMVAGAMVNGDSADEARADALTGTTVSDASSNLAIDFGFVPQPTYALGNLVWEDFDNDGVVDAGEPGIDGIDVELYLDVNTDGVVDGGDTLVGSDTTDSSGRYLFENLLAGDYLVHVPDQAALTDWFVGGTPSPTADQGNSLAADNDNDANPDGANGGYTSGAVTLGGAAGPADNDEPEGETDGNTSADAEAPVTTRDDRSNQTVDFGFWRGLRLGNQVWLDEGAGANQDNGVFDSDESGLLGVTVELWGDDGDGVFEPGGDDTRVGTTTTIADGRYYFEHVAEDVYFVAIPAGPAGTSSSTGAPGASLAVDGEDSGEPEGSYVAVSGPYDLAIGGAETGETDGPAGAAGEPQANLATGSYPDDSSFLTVDFGLINAPLYRLGNLVWFDWDNDGQAEDGEPGIGGVLVQLTDDAGAVLAETVTDTAGFYEFTGLAAGDYRVQIPVSQVPSNGALAGLIDATALNGFLPTTGVVPTVTNGEDGDSNGIEGALVTGTSVITLDGDTPVSETVRVDDATDDDTGQASPRIEDNRSDYSIDFGFYSISLGNLVFVDVNGDGLFVVADGDRAVAGVELELRAADGTVVDTTTTDAQGGYLFTGLRQDEQYYVQIPADQFDIGGPLEGLYSSIGDAGDLGSVTTDGPDRGVDPADLYGAVRSNGLVTASASTSPTEDGEGDNLDNDDVRPDAAENLTIDFGFYTMELGGTVFHDPGNDGQDDDEGDFSGVTLLLYSVDDVGTVTPFLRPDGSQATTVTDANGDYLFTGLPAGDYVVEIPAAEFSEQLQGYANSDGNLSTPLANNDVTGEDNGDPVGGDIFVPSAIRSSTLTLTPDTEATDDPAPSAGLLHSMSNRSVDFGFWNVSTGLELGNQLWFDDNRNGVFDQGELPLPALIELELLDADTLAVVQTTYTDADGRYLFTGLDAGDYIVRVTAVNFQPGQPLAGYMVTDGAGISPDPDDEVDSDSNGVPLRGQAANGVGFQLQLTGVQSAPVTLVAAAPTLEAQLASAGLDDRKSDLTVDFGFVRAPELAFTGADVGGALRLAAALLLAGLAFLVGSRRRRAS